METILRVLGESELSESDRLAYHSELKAIEYASDRDLAHLIGCIAEISPSDRAEARFCEVLHACSTRMASAAPGSIPPIVFENLEGIFLNSPKSVHLRRQMFLLLAATADQRAHRLFASLITEYPLESSDDIVMVFLPLFRRKDYDPDALYPKLFEGLAHVSMAGFILDLANALYREKRVEVHPAAQRVKGLEMLLAQFAEQLLIIEEKGLEEIASSDDSGHGPQEQVNSAVGCAVSLCDTLGLIGSESSLVALRKALEPSHRRLRTEAAAALACLDDEQGKQSLVSMAAEPYCRLRVIHYCEELDIVDEVDPGFRTPEAQAEGRLAMHLAEPNRMGMPPLEVTHIDAREMYWPGLQEPVECHLVRYMYRIPLGEFIGVGIVGPMVHAFDIHWGETPVEDIYSAYAGWDAEHDEITEIAIEELTDQSANESVDRLVEQLVQNRFCEIEPVKLGYFFGENVLVARAVFADEPVVLASDGNNVVKHQVVSNTGIDADVIYWIYKGRRLLATFNK